MMDPSKTQSSTNTSNHATPSVSQQQTNHKAENNQTVPALELKSTRRKTANPIREEDATQTQVPRRSGYLQKQNTSQLGGLYSINV